MALHNVAGNEATWDGAMLFGYLDVRQPNRSVHTPWGLAVEDNFRLASVTNHFDSAVDDVRIYDRVLSRQEINEVLDSATQPTLPAWAKALGETIGCKDVFDGEWFRTAIGLVKAAPERWIEHRDLGLLYVGGSGDDLWLWSASQGWWWTRLYGVFLGILRLADGHWLRAIHELNPMGLDIQLKPRRMGSAAYGGLKALIPVLRKRSPPDHLYRCPTRIAQ